MALLARNASPWLFSTFRDLEPPVHTPWSPVGTKTCTLVSGVFPDWPAAESARKDSRAEEQKMSMSKKDHIIRSNAMLPFREWDVSRGVTQASMSQRKVINRHPAVLVA